MKGHPVLLEIYPCLLLEFFCEPVHYPEVKVLATKEGITVGRLDLEYAFADLQDGDIKGTATKVKDCNLFFLLFVKAVGKGSGSGFVYYPQDVKPCNPAGILGSLPLAVVEVGGNGDYRFLHLFAKVVLGGLLHFT